VAPRSAQPLYAVYLERVINIPAVQCHRAAVTDDYATAHFFSEGYHSGWYGEFHWSVDKPEPFPWGGLSKKPVSPPMQHAWNAAVAAFKEFIKALANGELIASGEHPASGVRSEIDRVEWTRTDLILDVRNGDLFEERNYKRTLRWSAIVVQAAIQQSKPIDWDAEWSEDVARREKGQLPNEKAYVRKLETRIKERYGVTSVDGGDLRRFKVALYRGDSERPRSKRKKPKHKL